VAPAAAPAGDRGAQSDANYVISPGSQEQLPHWQLWRDLESPCASASLHQAHFFFPALTHAHMIYLLLCFGFSVPFVGLNSEL